MRNQFLLLSLVALATTLACGTTETPTEQTAAGVGEHGAGKVVKMNDALDAILPADYQIEKLGEGLIFTEGPLWVRDGSYLLFSDVRGNAVYKWAKGEGVTDFIKPVFLGEREGGIGPNGLTRDSKGNLVMCEHGNRCISRMALPKQGERKVLIDNFEGKKLNSPNDLVYKSDGSLYFTDPPYGFAQQDEDPAKELAFNGVFRLSPDEKTLEVVSKDQSRPNGLAFSPDEKILYVSNSDPARKAWVAYDVLEDGKLANGRELKNVTSDTAEGMPDGMKVDKNGNIFASGPGGIWIMAPDGTQLGLIQPEETPANCAWGDGGKSLYITARTGIYRLRLNTEGKIP